MFQFQRARRKIYKDTYRAFLSTIAGCHTYRLAEIEPSIPDDIFLQTAELKVALHLLL
jgi:hypothetical protein